MSITYTPATNFGAKDSLPTNDPDKVIKGVDFTTEFSAIQTAFTLAAPVASPTFTGTVTIPTADINGGTIDGVAFGSGTIDSVAIGGTTPAAGAFTTLQATSMDSTPIGGTTPAAGAFTTLEATSLDSTPIGGSTPAAGTFTTLTAASLAYPTSDGTAGQVIATNGSGTLSFADAGAAITMADSWRLTADSSSNGDITSNLERVDEASSGIIGTGMTESSGIFSFPETGIYLVICTLYASISGPDNVALETFVSTDGGSNYNRFATAVAGIGTDAQQNQGSTFSIIDVTSTANVKVKFVKNSIGAGSEVQGNTSENRTHFTFIRLGDT